MSTSLSDLWNQILEGIAERDSIIDSWNPETGVKKQFLSELVSENGAGVEQGNKLASQLRNIEDEDQRYALYHGLMDTLRSAFGKDFEAFVTTRVAELPKPEKVVVDEETRKTVTGERSDLYGKAKQLRDLALSIGEEGSEDWVMPAVRRAGSGKRGKRALSLYTWAIDGAEVAEDDNTPAGVAKLLGYDKAGDFTKDLKEQTVTDDEGNSVKLNTSKPPRNFEVTVRGKVVTASRVTEDDVEDDDSDADEDGDDD